MNLSIDTTNNKKIIIKLGEKTFSQSSKVPGGTDLLSLIIESLKKSKLSFDEIEAIEINPGPGSFAGLRTGFSVVNALGWSLKIPVNQKRLDKGEVPEVVYE